MYSENTIKTKEEVEKDTVIYNPTPNITSNKAPSPTRGSNDLGDSSKLKNYQIALIAIGLIVIMAIIVISTIFLIKKCKTISKSSKSGSGEGEDI